MGGHHACNGDLAAGANHARCTRRTSSMRDVLQLS
jgi:hypothetical protein